MSSPQCPPIVLNLASPNLEFTFSMFQIKWITTPFSSKYYTALYILFPILVTKLEDYLVNESIKEFRPIEDKETC